MRSKEEFLNQLEATQKGCRAELITTDEASRVYDEIKADWEKMSEEDKKRFNEYRYSNTQAKSRKWGKTGSVIWAGINRSGEFEISVHRITCGQCSFTGLGKKMKVIKKDGTVGIKEEWFDIDR